MSTCPHCQADIGDQFGLCHCPQCEQMIFVGVDGQVSAESPLQQQDPPADLSGSEPIEASSGFDFSDQAAFEPASSEENLENEPLIEAESSPFNENASFESDDFQGAPESGFGNQDFDGADWNSSQDFGLNESQGASANAESPMDAMSDQWLMPEDAGPAAPGSEDQQAISGEEEGFEDSEEPDVLNPEAVSSDSEYKEGENEDWEVVPHSGASELESAADSSDLSDLEAYGNSELSQARAGWLLYRVRIEGIDSADIREHLREVLEDRKFMLNPDQLMKSIRQGILVIADLNAIKASLLVSQIQELPIQISWEQYAVSQS